MPLISCAVCNGNVSDQAASCPQCGHPTHAATIEQTGKRWKALQLLGALMLILGLGGGFMAPEESGRIAGGVVGFIGLALYITGRVAAWWQHG